MRKLRNSIVSHQRILKGNRLFKLIHASSSIESLASMARASAWWPMVFQDVLRLNLERVRGSSFERFAQFHLEEDSGHDRWFMDDLRVLGVEPPGFDELFSDGFRPIRDACYSVMAEVLRPQSAKQRIALLLALEPTGHVFFEEISAAVDRLCPELPLRYFARSHLGVEKAHDLFTESTEADLDRIVLSDDERTESEAVASRIFQTFGEMLSYLADRVDEGLRRASHISELGSLDAASRPALRTHGS